MCRCSIGSLPSRDLGCAVFVLRVATPEGDSGRLVGDYLFAEPFMKTFAWCAKSTVSKTTKPRNARLSNWWAHTDSNRGPKDYELLGELLCLEKSFVGERRLA
ncbi:Hypothetical protein PSEBR_m1621 [Pseudomonas brassicacearum subsp. brassicacearum NFM421]|uniref:Uncharacterized protein n=1 Tax=Pseudomonas brassicacearum (strain NFM421) TaxID=994484 RepID=F2KM84_PSEBN|nr:Hypothetical protein PSEBR_m1621 [Pseudomonas brassicacearum subsp. brassicacearum NFM421]